MCCTVLHWLPIFTREESVQIIIDSLKFLQQKDNLKLYAYVILEQLQFYKKAHHKTTTYQLWEEEYQAKLIQTDSIMISKINYIHQNPVKRAYVDEAKHWRYSSARDYEGIQGLIDIERFW